MTKYYTTHELVGFLKNNGIPNYSSTRTLLEAFHNNRKSIADCKDKNILTQIWDYRVKVGKRWLFKKEGIDIILQ